MAGNSTIIGSAYYKLSSFIDIFTSKLVVAALILLIGFIIGKISGKLVRRALNEVETNRLIRKITRSNIPLEEIIAGFLTYFIYFLATVMALKHIGLATDILNILSGAVILVVVVSIILSVKDIIPNAFSGIVINSKKFLQVGDFIRIRDMEGTIKDIGLTEVLIESENGDMIRIPNSLITNTIVAKKKPGHKKFRQ